MTAGPHEVARLQQELAETRAELFDTNRGVLALYAELDEKADHLRRADELKTRFLSNMSHEFRTPLNSILALSRLLIDRLDGELNAEQEKQVNYIRKSATELLDLVGDLLDLAKVEAGKIESRPSLFPLPNLFAALRGMLRPLLSSPSVNLVFEDAETLPEVFSDEAKVAQILRNFISNALKFTLSGEVTVSARLLAIGTRPPGRSAPVEKESLLLTVSDTGIGIAPENQEFIFEEFTQVESPLQAKVRGTGLGLPLCRRLAGVLGGEVWMESTPGVGSVFSLMIPRGQPLPSESELGEKARALPPNRVSRPVPSPEP